MSTWSRDEAQSWADVMSYALVQQYGRWTIGWRWSYDEGDFDGGPVGNWCCPRDLLTTPEETLARVEAALREWREWLECLAGWFEACPLDLTDIEDQRILWERAARNLILQVVDRTGCGAAGTATATKCSPGSSTAGESRPTRPGVWSTRRPVDGSTAGPVLTRWWSTMSRSSLRSLQPADGLTRSDAPTQDHLRRWLAVRESVPWHEVPDSFVDGPVVPLRDGVAQDIRADDPQDSLIFVRYINIHLAETRRRTADSIGWASR
ncbi:hypothetical protein ACIQF5_29030 [Streptomyces goshikiensis]|uniref:hypothetical protein n=1 Tax=Streptomyces goshikiensis TaxID=1942 RepID=UPI0038126490